jgi:hypothetical protein
LLTQAGFINVTTTAAAPQTVYRNRLTRPAFIIQATKP